MQAIITKVLPATNTKPTRIKASCERGSIVVSYDHSGSAEEAHRETARSLCNKFCREDEKSYGTPFKSNPWNAELVTGQIPSSDYVHVFTAKSAAKLLEAANTLRNQLESLSDFAINNPGVTITDPRRSDAFQQAVAVIAAAKGSPSIAPEVLSGGGLRDLSKHAGFHGKE